MYRAPFLCRVGVQETSVPLLSPLLHAQTPIGPPGNVPCAPANPILPHSHMTWALLWKQTAEWSVGTAEAAKVCQASDHPLLHPLPSLFPVGPVNVAQKQKAKQGGNKGLEPQEQTSQRGLGL